MENMTPFGPANGQMPGHCDGMMYQIKPGDSLYLIAKQYHSSIEALLHANYGIDPYNLQVGSHICIPGVQAPAPSPAPIPVPMPAPAPTPYPVAPDMPSTGYYPTPPAMPDFFMPQTPYNAVPMAPYPENNMYLPENSYYPGNAYPPGNTYSPGEAYPPGNMTPPPNPMPTPVVEQPYVMPLPQETPPTMPAPMPAPVPVPMPAPISAPEPEKPRCCPRGILYTVKRDDSLTKILTAGDFCYASLLSYNPDLDPCQLAAGQQLYLPEKEVGAKSRSATSYTTLRSDSLVRVAESFKVSTDSLLVYNQALRPSDFSHSGTRIRIPEPEIIKNKE